MLSPGSGLGLGSCDDITWVGARTGADHGIRFRPRVRVTSEVWARSNFAANLLATGGSRGLVQGAHQGMDSDLN